MGDPAGIGPEVTLKALRSPEVVEAASPLIVGTPSVFRDLLPPGTSFPVYRNAAEVDWEVEGIKVLRVGEEPDELPPPGKIDPAWAGVAMECVEAGVKLALEGLVAGLVTAPINKEGIHRAGYDFQGHTDFLAHLTKTEDYAMMLAGDGIRVVLVTVHIPLSEVSRALTSEKIAAKIRLAHRAMAGWGIGEPRIAVAGLNPHAGEGGAFGKEEAEIIRPAVELCRGEGLKAEGPLPPDTLFYRLSRGEFDVAVVMYHDQGLIPLKLVAFDRGVNLTLGLPLIRTSPDHGTAYEIAGQGVADPRSMIEAVLTACRLASP